MAGPRFVLQDHDFPLLPRPCSVRRVTLRTSPVFGGTSVVSGQQRASLLERGLLLRRGGVYPADTLHTYCPRFDKTCCCISSQPMLMTPYSPARSGDAIPKAASWTFPGNWSNGPSLVPETFIRSRRRLPRKLHSFSRIFASNYLMVPSNLFSAEILY